MKVKTKIKAGGYAWGNCGKRPQRHVVDSVRHHEAGEVGGGLPVPLPVKKTRSALCRQQIPVLRPSSGRNVAT